MPPNEPNNPLPSNDPQNIYAPPEESSEKMNLCPSCGQEMEQGELYSNSTIKWRGGTLSKMKKFISGGPPIATTKSGLGCKYAAYHCKLCKLFTLVE